VCLINYVKRVDCDGKVYLLSRDVVDYLCKMFEGGLTPYGLSRAIEMSDDLLIREHEGIVLIDMNEGDALPEHWKRLKPRVLFEEGYRTNPRSRHFYEDIADNVGEMD